MDYFGMTNTCPTCKAAPGQDCRTRSGRVKSDTHHKRKPSYATHRADGTPR